MRSKTALAAFLVLVMFQATGAAAGSRTLEASVPRSGARTLALDTAVGDVSVTVSKADTVAIRVQLTPRKTGLFSSMKTARRQVESATLQVERRGKTLSVKIGGFSGDPRFEATWRLTVPADLALELDMGVGNLDVRGTRGRLEADLGVGDATVQRKGGDLSIDTGVGDITVRAPASAYGEVECSTGVGEITLKAGGRPLRGEGMIARDLTWTGNGNGSMKLDSGVGDIEVDLTPSTTSAGATPPAGG